MKTAIHFGAGNIGRGFIGGLLSLSGYHVVFADINSQIIDKLNKDKTYNIVIVDEKIEEQVIENVSGVHVEDENLPAYAETAELITAAVGPVALPKIALYIAKGIRLRREKDVRKHLNVIACENLFGASDVLKNAVFSYLSTEEKSYCEAWVGFPNSVVDRIVPPVQGQTVTSLDVKVEPFYEWIVDKHGFKGTIPDVKEMLLTDNLMAYVERKLLTLNTGHAVTAYLGKMSGYETIRQSISDEKIFKCVYGAMEESGAVLVEKHGFDKEAHMAYVNKIIKRFKNPYLDDSVDRVGREPMRKLDINDRLIKPIILAEKYNVNPVNLILGAAAAFHFYCENDQQSVELQEMIRNLGIKEAIVKVTKLDMESQIVEKISEAYGLMKDQLKLEEIKLTK